MSAFTVERGCPGTVSCMASLSSISEPFCSDDRQKILYKDVGMEEQVCPLVQEIQGAARQLTKQITLQKACNLIVSLLRVGATYLWWEFGESSGLEL